MDFPNDNGAGEDQPADVLEDQRILIVDDEDDVRTYLATVLEDVGALISEAGSGQEGIDLARREKPDLITLDLSMPGKDGIETFEELRSIPEVGDIPICIITGHSEFETVVLGRPVRSPEGFLNKPIQAETLLRRLRNIVSRARSGLPTVP